MRNDMMLRVRKEESGPGAMFNPGFDIRWDEKELEFTYGLETFGPPMELRRLEDIRRSLGDPNAEGPAIPYSIAMDVGKKKDLEDLKRRNLLFGAVIYSKGHIGKELVRSQGHIHAKSASCGSSTPEVYEIWSGRAIVFMQETAQDDPGRCFAVYGNPGDVIIVPPGWAHYTANADCSSNMVFGAFCIRDYGFDYGDVRAHGGLAYFPEIAEGCVQFVKNPAYSAGKVVVKRPRSYKELGIRQGMPIYEQYELDPQLYAFVTDPMKYKDVWDDFEP